MIRSAEYQRGYDAGYKQALLDAVRGQGETPMPRRLRREPTWPERDQP